MEFPLNIPEPLLAQAHLGSWCWDVVSNEVTWSPELYRIFGLDPAFGPPDMERRREIYTPECMARLEAGVKRCLETGEPFRIMLTAKRPDGVPIYLEAHGALGRDEQSRPARLHGVVLDRTEEQNARLALEASEAQFASAFEYAVIGKALVSPDGRWLKANRAMCEMLGHTEAELLTRTFQEITHPDDLEADLGFVKELLAGERQTYQMEKRYRHRSGRTVWALLSVSLVRDAAGQPLNFISQVQDVTERKLAEAERKRLFDFSLDLLCVSGFDGYLRQVNPAWTRVLGWSEEELLTRPVLDLVHPDDVGPTRDGRKNLMIGQTLEDLENRYRCKDGSYRWLSWRSFALPEEGVVFAVARDITERKQSETSLRQASDRLRLATRAARLGIWDWDLVTNEAVWDEGMRELYDVAPGVPLDEMREWNRAVAPEDDQRLKEEVSRVLAGGTDWVSEFRIRRPDGSIRHLQTNAIVQRDAAGAAVRMIGTNRDITEEIELQDRLRRAGDAAEAASRAKSEFLAMMSHEIRTPMNAVIGYGDLLRLTALTEEQSDMVDNIQRGGANLLEIIEGILDFSKIEAGKLSLRSETYTPRGLIADVCELLAVTARARGLGFEQILAPDLPPVLIGDPQAIKRVLTNLVGNAIKFTERGSVSLAATCASIEGVPSLRIEVNDTGIGLTPETLERLFRPFSQGDSSNKRRFGGTGLGLVISSRLAEALGGDLTAKSRPEGGATFVFSFPLRSEIFPDPNSLLPANGGPTAPVSSDLHILLVEDNAVNRHLMTQLIHRLGCTCEAAKNGREALEAIARTTYDVVLMDLQMPVMDGWETTREIRRREAVDPAIPRHYLIAQSASAMEEDARRCREAGMNDHLCKPITLRALAAALARVPTGTRVISRV